MQELLTAPGTGQDLREQGEKQLPKGPHLCPPPKKKTLTHSACWEGGVCRSGMTWTASGQGSLGKTENPGLASKLEDTATMWTIEEKQQ